jgi:transcriptional repressor NrdR
MQCPFCHASDTKVTDSRLGGEGQQVRRRRECTVCNQRFTTYEIIELSLPRLVKKDGRYVQFEEGKLRAGILRSLEKRPISLGKIDQLVNNILVKLKGSTEREITTKLLGKWVMLELRDLDEVAYLRFASVYGCFSTVNQFKEVIENLQQNSHNSDHENSETTIIGTTAQEE